MDYLWLEFTGWVNMIRPHLFPFLAILTYVYAAIITKVVLIACKIPKGSYLFFKVFSLVALISLCLFVLECIVTHVFSTLMRFNDYRIYSHGGDGLSIYENATLFIFTSVSVFFCIYICYKLNSQFTIRCIDASKGNRTLAIILLSILTSPLLFFITFDELMRILFPIRW